MHVEVCHVAVNAPFRKEIFIFLKKIFLAPRKPALDLGNLVLNTPENLASNAATVSVAND